MGSFYFRIIATAWQAQVAARQRDYARVQQARAARLNTFLQDMLGFANIFVSGGRPSRSKRRRLIPNGPNRRHANPESRKNLSA